jgi:hypothetical protein
MTTQRFVSLHGFFAVEHPTEWTQETDEHGQYIFYNPNGGSGVGRIMMLDNEFTGDDADVKLLEEVYTQHRDFEPQLLAVNTNRFIHYKKLHDINGSNFTVSYWVTAKQGKVVLISYTVQTSMKEMDVAIQEVEVMTQMVTSFTWMHDNAIHG